MAKPLAACGALVIAVLVASGAGLAHHPISSEFDAEREMTLRGTVEKFEWKSPHATLVLRAEGSDERKAWTIELDGEDVLGSLGWSRDTIENGQSITVMAWPARDGSARAVARAVTLADGRELAALNPHDEAYAEYARRNNERQDASREGEVTLVGCVELEADYRQRTDAGRGGVLGTGIGVSNEYVLVDARPAPAELGTDRAVGTSGDDRRDDAQADGDARASRDGDAQAGAVGTSGGSEVYSLTGDQESNLSRAVGRQVHIVGTLENADSAERPAAADARVSELPRVNISAWHPVNDFCPAPR